MGFGGNSVVVESRDSVSRHQGVIWLFVVSMVEIIIDRGRWGVELGG